MEPNNNEQYKNKTKLKTIVNDMLEYYQIYDKPGSKEFNEYIKLLLYNKTKIKNNQLNTSYKEKKSIILNV